MDKMRKYREAFGAIQHGYEYWIDRLGRSEAEAFSYQDTKLNGLKEVAIYDTEISAEDFWEINDLQIMRRPGA